MTILTRTRAHSVTEILRERIQNGEIAPGTHLMEIPLAQELGVSRTPVHDALTRLADEGLVVANPNRGFVVRRFVAKDVHDAMTLRATLEGLGARLVGEKGLDDAAHARLAGMLEAQHRALHADTWNAAYAAQWQELNLDFHYALLELADNPWLTDAVRRARKLPVIFDHRARPHDQLALWQVYQRDQSRQALLEHRQIVEHLRRHEVQRAEAKMQEHILTNRDVLMQRLLAPASEPAEAGHAPQASQVALPVAAV